MDPLCVSVPRGWFSVRSLSKICYFDPQMIRLTALLLLLLVPASSGEERLVRPTAVNLTREGERWAERTLKKLTLEQKIGQLFMVRAHAEFLNLESPEYLRLKQAMERYHVGGFLLTVRAEGALIHRGQPFEAAMLTNQLQADSELPLLFAADFERGLYQRLNGTTPFPHAMAFGATGDQALATQFGRTVAQEARAIGVHWNFFPVADVNHNPRNPIINARAFGEDAGRVSDFVAAYIRGARDGGLLTTVKHFPGHGDSENDTHLSVATLRADLGYLEAVDLRPFKKAIVAGVDAVMVAHVAAPELDPTGRVSSLSQPVIDGILRDQLKFSGLVVPDALDMGAIAAGYPNGTGGRAAVDAILAGNDLVLLPADLDAAYSAMLKAVTEGEIPESRLDRSVLRILRAKASVGLYKARAVDIDNVSTAVGRPSSVAFAQRVSDAAATLVLDNGAVLPLARPGTAGAPDAYQAAGSPRARVLAVVFSDDLRTESGRQFERELRQRDPATRVITVDPGSAAAQSARVLAAAEDADVVIAAVYSLPTASKKIQVQGMSTNSISLDDASSGLLGRLLDSAAPRSVVVSLGSPYLVQAFPRTQNYLCTYSNAPVSEISAVRALYAEIPVRGRLPVTIPGVARRGYGLDLLPTVAQGVSNAN